MNTESRFALLGVIFAVVYMVLAAGAAGFGHGTYFFFIPAWPYGFGILIYPLISYLIAVPDKWWAGPLSLILLLLHYSIIAALIYRRWSDEAVYIEKTWMTAPLNLMLPALWLLTGHTALWFHLATKLHRPPN